MEFLRDKFRKDMQEITQNLMVGQEVKSSKIGTQFKAKSAAGKAAEQVEANIQKLSGLDQLQHINDLMKETNSKKAVSQRDKLLNA